MTKTTYFPTTLPIDVFYDGTCPLCSAEMEAISAMNRDGNLRLIDCTAAAFDRNAYQSEGVTFAAMMKAMHIRDACGQWWQGPDAFVHIYNQVDMKRIAQFWGSGALRPLTKRLYPFIANNRHHISAFGGTKLFSMLTRRMARQANARYDRLHQTCANDNCQIPTKGANHD